LQARLPPELNLGKSLTDLEKVETATVEIKRQTICKGKMKYSEDSKLLKDFLKEAKELE
jgi:hypothetical protein